MTFKPNYRISPFLLERIKEITLLVHTLNQRLVSDVVLVQMRDTADPSLKEGHGSRGQGMMLAGIDPTARSFRFAWEGGGS